MSFARLINEEHGLPLRREWSWWWLLAAGTAVRFLFGWTHQLWNSSPDQLAWGLGLVDIWSGNGDGYDQWVHYPHEGGTLLQSLLARAFVPWAGIMPPLSWVALSIDTLSRAIQIVVVRRLVDPGPARLFMWWTVFAAPIMLPWGTVNMGAHGLVACAPFVLLLLVSSPERPAFRIGLVVGLMSAFAYDCWVLAPVYVAHALLTTGQWGQRFARVAYFTLGALVAVAPHVLVRVYVDHGFQLEQWPALSIRGLEQGGVDWATLPGRFLALWVTWLPASFHMASIQEPMVQVAVRVTAVMMVVGLVGLFWRRSVVHRYELLAFGSVVSFLLIMAATPFFEPRMDGNGYVYYRYFPFIAPLVSLLVIVGLARVGRVGGWAAKGWVVACAVSSLVHMWHQRSFPMPLDEATGWVLGRKYGHAPERLFRIVKAADPDQVDALSQGAAWGTTAALFDGRTLTDTSAIDRFERLVARWPADRWPLLNAGVIRAFDPEVTPTLDARSLPAVQKVMDNQQ
jgi:hypothetical protein